MKIPLCTVTIATYMLMCVKWALCFGEIGIIGLNLCHGFCCT